jgi:predicted transcriptional regulator
LEETVLAGAVIVSQKNVSNLLADNQIGIMHDKSIDPSLESFIRGEVGNVIMVDENFGTEVLLLFSVIRCPFA